MKIVVISHGDFAESLVETATHLFNNSEGVEAINYTFHAEPKQLREVVKKKINTLNEEEEMLFLVDLFGGTPFTIVSEQIMNNRKLGVITGVNLPMLLGAIGGRQQPIFELIDQLTVGGQESIRKLILKEK